LSVNILVTAVGGGVGQAILRALKKSSLHYKVVGTDINPWAAGLYCCDQGYLVPAAGHESYGAKILEICAEERVNVVIPGSDPELPWLAELAPKLLEAGIISIVGSKQSVQICRDKQKAYSFFSSKNLPFIKTLRLNSDADFRSLLASDFPLVVKPFNGSASQDVHVVFNMRELEKLRGDKNKDFIIQEYLIPKGWNLVKGRISQGDVKNRGRLVQIDEISIQVLLTERGAPVASFTSLNSLKDGVPITIEPQKGMEAEEIARQMAKALGEVGLKGPCNFQCKLTAKGPQFFEVNPRFTGITAVRARFGFNEVEALIRLFYYKEELTSLNKLFEYDDALFCSRYTTEYIFTREDLNKLKEKGHT
jgi:carbamoylphosphate synthase large subunit